MKIIEINIGQEISYSVKIMTGQISAFQINTFQIVPFQINNPNNALNLLPRDIAELARMDARELL